MIVLTKLDGNEILVNTDNIKYVEKTPDTLVHFLNGDTLMIKDELNEIETKVKKFHASTLAMSSNG